jgi:hypothetical protein
VLQLAGEVGIHRTSISAPFTEQQAIRIRAQFSSNYESIQRDGARPTMRRRPQPISSTARPRIETGLTHRIGEDWPAEPEQPKPAAEVDPESFDVEIVCDTETIESFEVASFHEIPRADLEIYGERYRTVSLDGPFIADEDYPQWQTVRVNVARVDGGIHARAHPRSFRPAAVVPQGIVDLVDQRCESAARSR